MKTAGVTMVEVGTTNKTHLQDYANAISDKTALIFKAHKSNYTIEGFTTEVDIAQLSVLCREHTLPLVYDIGSGLLQKPRRLQSIDEPDVATALAHGADMVCFSADKLLGGPQAGIICGKMQYIEPLGRTPLLRALRVGKLTYAALAGALRRYTSVSQLLNHNPLLAALNSSDDEIAQRAEKLRLLLSYHNVEARVVPSSGSCGGGTLPALSLRSFGVTIKQPHDHQQLFSRLHHARIPVIGVLREGKLVFDMLTVQPSLIEDAAEIIADTFHSLRSTGTQ
jgi:L-seryl-tRNA(Ser) seleniumtransferase